MRKFVIGAAVSAATLGGSMAAALAINPLGIAGAQTGTSTPPTTAAAQPGPTSDPGAARRAGKDGPQQILDDTLNDLVSKGTINQDQANAVRDGLKSRIEAWRSQHGGRGPGRGGPGVDLKRDLIGTAAQTIGITPEQLMTEHKAGKTLAQIAQAHGVDPQKVADAIIAKISADIDKAVADGRLPADRAAKMKQELAKRVPEMLNRNCYGGAGDGKGDHKGDGNSGDTPPSTEPPSTEPSTTAPPTTEAPGTTVPTPPGTTGTQS